MWSVYGITSRLTSSPSILGVSPPPSVCLIVTCSDLATSFILPLSWTTIKEICKALCKLWKVPTKSLDTAFGVSIAGLLCKELLRISFSTMCMVACRQKGLWSISDVGLTDQHCCVQCFAQKKHWRTYLFVSSSKTSLQPASEVRNAPVLKLISDDKLYQIVPWSSVLKVLTMNASDVCLSTVTVCDVCLSKECDCIWWLLDKAMGLSLMCTWAKNDCIWCLLEQGMWLYLMSIWARDVTVFNVYLNMVLARRLQKTPLVLISLDYCQKSDIMYSTLYATLVLLGLWQTVLL